MGQTVVQAGVSKVSSSFIHSPGLGERARPARSSSPGTSSAASSGSGEVRGRMSGSAPPARVVRSVEIFSRLPPLRFRAFLNWRPAGEEHVFEFGLQSKLKQETNVHRRRETLAAFFELSCSPTKSCSPAPSVAPPSAFIPNAPLCGSSRNNVRGCIEGD